jgi:dephospho-CoA kinase
MLIYGITGGIGSGKSTVSALLEQQGFRVFNADAVGRELLGKKSGLTEEVLRRFPGVGLADGGIDRRLLAERVFADAQALRTLESLMHPVIWSELTAHIEALDPRPPLCFLEAALLADYDVPVRLAGLLLVTAPLSVRLRRVCERDGISREQALARVKSQSSDEEKMRRATYVIDNGGSAADTKQQLKKIIRLIVQKARQQESGN